MDRPTSAAADGEGVIVRRPYSTTSSVYAEHTLSNPDNDQVLYCIGAILQAQLFDNYVNPRNLNAAPSLFSVRVDLPPECGGPAQSIPMDVLQHETLNDLELREKLIQGVVPTVHTMYKFMKFMITRANFSVECNILALVYVTRITSNNELRLSMDNWRGFWIAAIILAQKVWDDIPLRTSAFAAILPNVSRDDLRKMEMEAFRLLDFNTTVKPSVYAQYYFELRELFLEICGGDLRFVWKLTPLSAVQARKLEEKSNLQGGVQASPASSKRPLHSASSTNNSNSVSSASSAAGSITSTPSSAARTPSSQYSGLVDQDFTMRGRYVIS